MISPATVVQIRELLAQGALSHRRIAKLTGVSRATIGAIASGKRPDYESRPRPEADAYLPIGPAARCPMCGSNVLQPCLACFVRKIKDGEDALKRAYRKRLRELRLRRLMAQLRREASAQLARGEMPRARAG